MSRIAVLAGVVALGAVVAVADVTAPAAVSGRAAEPSRARVETVTLVCPNLAGQSGAATTTLTAGAAPGLAGAGTAVLQVHGTDKPASLFASPGPAVSKAFTAPGDFGIVTVDGALAAGAEASQVTLAERGGSRGLTGSRCTPPTRESWFVGGSGRVGTRDALWLVNPDTTPALVDVEVWSEHGPVNAPTGEGIDVPAGGRAFFALPDLAPDEQMVALHVVARTGRVSAAVSDLRLGPRLEPRGSDWVPETTAPARTSVVPGFFAGDGVRWLFVANPGEDDATVQVKVSTRGGQFVPTGLDAVQVQAGQVTRIDVKDALQSGFGSVSVTSDHPVAVEGFADGFGESTGYRDVAWLAALPALAGPALVTDNRVGDGWSSRLVAAAPGRASVVEVQGIYPGARPLTVSIPAGRTSVVDLSKVTARGSPGGAVVVRPVSGVVHVARLLSFAGARGPLMTAQPLTALPGEVVMPTVRQDDRVGLPLPR